MARRFSGDPTRDATALDKIMSASLRRFAVVSTLAFSDAKFADTAWYLAHNTNGDLVPKPSSHGGRTLTGLL